MLLAKLLGWIFFFCIPQTGYSQSGAPFISNHPPTAYNSELWATSPFNWGVAQDQSGLIYIGNTNRVLTFDGANWDQIPGTENKLFFKFASDTEGKVFTGGVNDLGYFAADSLGYLVFNSLKAHLPDSALEFKRILNVVSTSDGIWFQDGDFLFLWNGNNFSIWRDDGKVGKIFSCQERVYVSKAGGELWTYAQGELRAVPVPNDLGRYSVRGLMVTGGTDASPDLLVITNKSGIFTYRSDPRGQRTWEKTAFPETTVWNACAIGDEHMALATGGEGVLVIDGSGQIIRRIDEQQGLQSNSAKFPFLDKNQALWVALEGGVSHIEIDHPVSLIGKDQGLLSMPIQVEKHGDELYVGTIEGCYRISGVASGGTSVERMDGIEGQVWGLLSIDGILLIGTNRGLFLLRNGQLVQETDRSVAVLLRSAQEPRRVYFGGSGQVASLLVDNGEIILEGSTEEVTTEILYLAEEKTGKLWASQFDVLGLNPTDGIKIETPFTRLDSSKGYNSEMGEVEAQILDGELRFSTSLGLFRLSEEGSMVPDSTLGSRFMNQGLALYYATGSDDNFWAFDSKTPGHLFRDSEGKWTWDATAFSHLDDKEIWCSLEEEDGNLWLGNTEGLYHYDPSKTLDPSREFPALIRRVRINDSLEIPSLPGSIPEFDFSQNDIEFDFAAIWFLAPSKTSFSYQLEGRDEQWSDWVERTQKEFTDLREGKYTFRLKARNLYGMESSVASYSFVILPPWYRTMWAMLLWVVLAIGLIGGAIIWNTRRALRRQEARRKSELARERALRQVAVDAQEQERKRIAADLHDDIQATLSLAKLQAGFLNRSLKKLGEDGNTEQDPVKTIGDAIQSVRRISRDLMPASLERKGLGSALRELCKKANGDAMSANIEGEDLLPELPKSTEISLYRIFQELFSNTLKHAEATEISIQIQPDSQGSSLEYRDNGKGFSMKEAETGGSLGMQNLTGRAELIGAKLEIQTAPGQGFQARVHLPHQDLSKKK